MIESPLIQEMLAQKEHETMQQIILRILDARFGEVPDEVSAQVRLVIDEERLADLAEFSALCPDLDTFRVRLRG